MKKKVGIALGTIAGLWAIPNGIVLATTGVDGWQAFLATQEAMLDGLKAYFDALLSCLSW